MSCVKPLWLYIKKTGQGILAPCGKCLSCRSMRRSVWSARLSHEMAYHDVNRFVTLTYDDEHLPEGGSLVKSHLQKYFKRLRKCGLTFKYFSAGEYGDKKGRPHYHVIFFLDMADVHDSLCKCWPYGTVKVLPCEIQSIQYVTGYVQKKIVSLHDEFYTDLHLLPPFQLQSQGLGLQWAKDNKRYLESNYNVHLSGKSVGLPRYYADKLELDKDILRFKADERSKEDIKRILSLHGDKFSDFQKDLLTNAADPRNALYILKRDLAIYRQKALQNDAIESRRERGSL